MVDGWQLLALFTYLGGLSAATAMVIVESVALSTMLCNDLIMPVLLRMRWLRLNERPDLSGLLLAIRRGSILGTLLLGYVYFKLVGEVLRPGHHGPGVVLRRRAVRAADPARHLLEGGHPARRAPRFERRAS